MIETGFFLAAFLLYLSFAVFSIDKPLTMDQSFNVTQNASGIARYGFSALSNPDRDYVVAHPPLHRHLMALIFKSFGESTITARLLNVLCTAGVLFLILQLAKQLDPGKRGIAIGGIAMLIYAFNPFVIQHSLLVDQETSILPLFLMLFLWLLYRLDFKLTPRSVALLSATFALCLWGKEFPPYFALAALFPFLLGYRGFRHAFGLTVLIGILGTGLFIVTWLLYCAGTGVAVDSFFSYSVASKLFNFSFHKNRPALDGLRHLYDYTGRWLTFAFLLLLLLSAIHRIGLLFRERFALKPIDFLWIYVVLYWAATNLHMFRITRYQFPLYSVAVLLVARFLYEALGGLKRKEVAAMISVGMLAAIPLIMLCPDPLLNPSHSYLFYSFVIPAIGCFVLFNIACGAKWRRTDMTAALASLLIATSLSLNIKQTRPYVTSVSWGEYGEEGFWQTLDYLLARMGNSVPIVRKDFGYYILLDRDTHDYEWIYNSLFRGNLKDPEKRKQVTETLSRDEVRWVVLDQYSNSEAVRELISAMFEKVETFGDFEVYRKRDSSLASSESSLRDGG